MASSPAFKRPYLDANVYIAAISGPQAADPAKVQLAAEILQLAEQGMFQVFASTFIEAEVIKPAGSAVPLTQTQEGTIEAYFNRDCFVWIEVDRPIAQKARQIARDHSGFRPPDAVHVASALRANCDQLLTWDENLNNKGAGRTIETLYICPPHLAGYQASFLPPVLPSGATDGIEEETGA